MAQFTPASFNERVVACAIALAGFLIYAGTLGHQYTLDDLQVVQHNPVVTEGRLLDALTTSYWPEATGAGASN